MFTITKSWRDIKPPSGSQLNFSHPLSRGLVGCWLMNEGRGKIIKDLCGNFGKSTFFNQTRFSVSSAGSGLLFDGTDDYLTIPDNNLLVYPVTQSFTWISFFIMNNVGTSSQTLMRQDYITTPRNLISLNFGSDEKLVWALCGNISRLPIVNGSTTLIPKKLYMAVGVRNAQKDVLELYLNGVKDATNVTDTTAETINVNAPLYFGAMDYDKLGVITEELYGSLIFNLIYNRALSSSEIQALYEAPYQFIQPIRRRFISVGTAGAAPPLEAVGAVSGSFLTLGVG